MIVLSLRDPEGVVACSRSQGTSITDAALRVQSRRMIQYTIIFPENTKLFSLDCRVALLLAMTVLTVSRH